MKLCVLWELLAIAIHCPTRRLETQEIFQYKSYPDDARIGSDALQDVIRIDHRKILSLLICCSIIDCSVRRWRREGLVDDTIY